MSAAHVFGGARKHYFARVLADVFVHSVYLIEGFLYRGGAHDASVDPDGEEDGVHAAFPHAGNVDVAAGVALAQIVVLGEEALCGVIVRVQHDGREMQFVRLRGNIVNCGSPSQHHSGDQATNGTQNDGGDSAHHSASLAQGG